MKKVTVILFILFDLLILPAALYAFAPRSVISVLDMPFFEPYVLAAVLFLTLLFSSLGTAFWAAVSVAYTAGCMAAAGKRGELTPLYSCLMPLLCVVSIVCYIAAPQLVRVAEGV